MTFAGHPLASRAIALAVLGLVVWLLFAGILVPVARFVVDAGPIDVELRELSLLKALVSDREELSRTEAALRGSIASSGVFWPGESDNKIAALLQSKLQSLLAGQGQLVSVSNNAPRKEQGLRRVSIRVEASLPVREVQSVAAKLEESSPTIFVDRFSITASPAGPDAPPNVTLECDLSAYEAQTP